MLARFKKKNTPLTKLTGDLKENTGNSNKNILIDPLPGSRQHTDSPTGKKEIGIIKIGFPA